MSDFALDVGKMLLQGAGRGASTGRTGGVWGALSGAVLGASIESQKATIANIEEHRKKIIADHSATAASAVVAGCNSHRGRWQAQGIAANRAELNESNKWALCDPLPKPLGRILLTHLSAKTNFTDSHLRAPAFIQASQWINNVAPSGVGPMKRSFTGEGLFNLQRLYGMKDTPRVDVEVQAGIAFVG
ncbi:hypothetical protein [Rhizobium sp. Leaf262]|uniref:hypothetical protein n=1 Tax=Rhizobium sp. Leaf262 TaxID=1736312 RepID=UPI000AD44491|nr:hypothetical protein [Rhizobium sp. Leaf262]